MTVITKPLSQQEKNEKQPVKESCMYDVPLSDNVKSSDSDVEAPKKVYCYTRGKKTDSTNVWIVLTIMVLTCVILAILGYYQLNCLRKKGQENIRKRQEALQQYQDFKQQDSYSEFKPSKRFSNEVVRPDENSTPVQNIELTTVSTSSKKYHRGSCRVPCHVQQTFQQLCPRRSSQYVASPANVLAGQPPKDGISLVLGGLGDLQGTKEEQELVHSRVDVQKSREVEQDNFGANGTFELTYELDLEQETFELVQMPEVSSGGYLHDFTVNRTAIIELSRCFVMVMDRNEIAPPRTFYDMIKNIREDGYELNLNEIQHDMRIILPELEAEEVFKEYGMFIGRLCNDKTVYKLEPVPEEVASAQNLEKEIENDLFASFPSLGDFGREKRSTKGEKMFKELSKFSINYNIVNYHVL